MDHFALAAFVVYCEATSTGASRSQLPDDKHCAYASSNVVMVMVIEEVDLDLIAMVKYEHTNCLPRKVLEDIGCLGLIKRFRVIGSIEADLAPA